MRLMNTVSKAQALAILAQQGNRYLTTLRGTVFVPNGDSSHVVNTKTDLYDVQVAAEEGTNHILLHWSRNETLDHDEIVFSIGTATFSYRVKPVTELPEDTTEETV